jgi:hypothetical protein
VLEINLIINLVLGLTNITMISKTTLSLSLIATFLVASYSGIAQNTPLNHPSIKSSGSDSILFSSLVARYTRSIELADTVLGSQIWADKGEVSFIYPGGNEYKWHGIRKIYKMFGDYFTGSKLTFYDLRTTVYKNVAWLQFYWIFDAKMKTDNSPVQTKGRETQIWRKLKGEWRLVHVHYSESKQNAAAEGSMQLKKAASL